MGRYTERIDRIQQNPSINSILPILHEFGDRIEKLEKDVAGMTTVMGGEKQKEHEHKHEKPAEDVKHGKKGK
jgi:hypothetical protein